MTQTLSDHTIAILATEGVEFSELDEPRQALRDAGATVELVSLDTEPFRAFDSLDPRGEEQPDVAVADADASRYDGLLLPGGVANPDKLRQDEDAVAFVRAFFEAGKPVSAICHAPWTLIEAGVLEGRTVTSFPSLKTDLENAGAKWVDEEVHVDAGLTTSRNPGDIPAFISKSIEEFAEGKHRAQKRSV
ncbi:MAG: type 1 glutamine amidotransferase [Patulibacter sp.]|nr:type 1 glutamine amidotransferase [Patulibacter sp.]